MQSYYTDSTNAFHCPSGIPRMGFERERANWERLAEKHGVCKPSRRGYGRGRAYFTSY